MHDRVHSKETLRVDEHNQALESEPTSGGKHFACTGDNLIAEEESYAEVTFQWRSEIDRNLDFLSWA